MASILFGKHGTRAKKAAPPPLVSTGGSWKKRGSTFSRASSSILIKGQSSNWPAHRPTLERRCAKIIDQYLYIKKRLIEKLKLNSSPSSLSSSFPIHSPHVFNYCKFIVRFILDAPIFPPPSSMQLHKMCNLRNCIAQQQRLTRVNP